MKRKTLVATILMASMTFLAACTQIPVADGSKAKGTEIGETIKVGFNFENTGSVAAYGSVEQKGALLAVEEINQAGGIDGKQIEVISKDNKSETQEAASVSTNLAIQQQVNAIVGPATSGATAAAIPKATIAGVPVISPSATQDGLTAGQDFLFVGTFQDSYQGRIIAKYVADNLNAKKVALFTDNSSDYAKGIAKSFKGAYKGDIVIEETFIAGDTDFQAALTKMKGQDFDAMVLPGYYTEAGKIVNQMRGMGLNQPVVGGDGLNSEEFVQQATAEKANDIYFVSGFSSTVKTNEEAESFKKAYKKRFNEEPSTFSALAYDSMKMMAKAMEGAENSIQIRDNLTKVKDYEGVTGKTSFDADHNTTKSAFMMTMQNGKVEEAVSVQPD
ncbi:MULTISPECIES: ABC transporter substrate-binding protein [unclassified Streptococcus]|uniref:ABC transporter substrate-binding protein n=1 Tax=unclassified Streptococcus TaxID=2608887 RepID=UPI001072EA71|nr:MULTISPECIES: ABC transporter substrate-binding protein [unclassified Streptococcus]MBF0806004.1 ABC transporter substrate-binding protein [Streptococcus sp. 19428wA2_WM07]TFU28409.1 ABC transporter substrate-binding protein [Streptococcus sp. WM07]